MIPGFASWLFTFAFTCLPEMKLSTKPIILVVDDDLNILAVLEARLSSIDYRVLTASGGEQALELLKSRQVDLMITDVKMPGMGGMDLFSAAQAVRPGLPVMFLTAFGTIPDAVKAVKAGAVEYLTKPFNGRDLILKVQEVLRKSAPKPTLDTLPPLSESLWGGKSPAMRELYDLVNRIARSDVNVLILGESGVGKERVARLLHQRGPRREQPFIVVDCGSTPSGLLESELLGTSAAHLPMPSKTKKD